MATIWLSLPSQMDAAFSARTLLVIRGRYERGDAGGNSDQDIGDFLIVMAGGLGAVKLARGLGAPSYCVVAVAAAYPWVPF